MKHRKESPDRLTMAGPMVLFVGVFVVCCGILTCVFLRSAQLSREAAQYNEAVALCRSQAEGLRAGEIPEAQSWFDGSLEPCSREAAEYLLLAEDETKENCRVWTLTVCTPEREALYSLEIYMQEAKK